MLKDLLVKTLKKMLKNKKGARKPRSCGLYGVMGPRFLHRAAVDPKALLFQVQA
jgi:hypothetical protein